MFILLYIRYLYIAYEVYFEEYLFLICRSKNGLFCSSFVVWVAEFRQFEEERYRKVRQNSRVSKNRGIAIVRQKRKYAFAKVVRQIGRENRTQIESRCMVC